jgi:hypothetical protein
MLPLRNCAFHLRHPDDLSPPAHPLNNKKPHAFEGMGLFLQSDKATA